MVISNILCTFAVDKHQEQSSTDGLANRWSSMRAYHDHALIDEFQRRGIDTSAVYDGKAISFAHPVRYDLPDNRLVAVA